MAIAEQTKISVGVAQGAWNQECAISSPAAKGKNATSQLSVGASREERSDISGSGAGGRLESLRL
jgi:hypothetical protein